METRQKKGKLRKKEKKKERKRNKKAQLTQRGTRDSDACVKA